MDEMNERKNTSVVSLSTLSFDHPLSNSELVDTINLLSSGINLTQVYFKDDIDLKSIEEIKYLLEALPNINDRVIDKYIMKQLSTHDNECLMNMNFFNIDTWNIAYSKEDNCYSITSLAKYRKVCEWEQNIINEANNNNLSILEKICYIYDRVKLFDYDTKEKYNRLPEIISSFKANSYGYNAVFKELLSKLGIKAELGIIQGIEEEVHCCAVIVNDDKYNIHGMYFFDPSSDTISKDQYKNNLARRLNYNFFGLSLDKFTKLDNTKPMGWLQILSSFDYEEFLQRLKIYENRHEYRQVKRIENVFDMSIDKLFDLNKKTIDIDQNVIFEVASNRLNISPISVIDKDSFMMTICNNYLERNKELFLKN